MKTGHSKAHSTINGAKPPEAVRWQTPPSRGRGKVRCLLLALVFVLGACAGPRLGRPFRVDPRVDVKVGFDTKRDVITKMGKPYRTFVDSAGREVLTYVWADGRGGGEKCLIALNKNGLVYLIEVYP